MNIVMLSLPYGFPKIMSPYVFNDHDEAPPKSSAIDNCGKGEWVCEHRWTGIANMVMWRKLANGGKGSMDNYFSDDNSHVAFTRNDKTFIAMNRNEHSKWHIKYYQLPKHEFHEGIYCNILGQDDIKNCADHNKV